MDKGLMYIISFGPDRNFIQYEALLHEVQGSTERKFQT